MHRSVLPAIVLALFVAGCVDEGGPDTQACEASSVELDLALTAESLSPTSPAVCRDQEVTLLIASEVDGVLHIHGYDRIVPPAQVVAGEELRLTFTATRSGQFPIELHPGDDPRGVGVGIFTVHEP